MRTHYFIPSWALLVAALATNIGQAQDEPGRKTYFQNLFLDYEGHICYAEGLDENPMNRIEYRTDGRDIIGIFLAKGDIRTKVEITDFNADGKADLVYIEKDHGEHDVTKVNFFRGPQYQEHLRRHFGHALRTASHPLIKDEPEERERTKKIEEGMELLDKTTIGPDDIGVYSADGLFQVIRHKDIEFAFVAADTLNNALRAIVEGDYRLLSQEPQIVKKYDLEINLLTRIDPAVHLVKTP